MEKFSFRTCLNNEYIPIVWRYAPSNEYSLASMETKQEQELYWYDHYLKIRSEVPNRCFMQNAGNILDRVCGEIPRFVLVICLSL